jgi:hypothetical protein
MRARARGTPAIPAARSSRRSSRRTSPRAISQRTGAERAA